MKLLDSQVKAFKVTNKVQKIPDGGGLYLFVNPNGSKWWRFLYRYGGKQQTLSLGVYPDVSLKDAREKAAAMRESLEKGKNPSIERKESKIKKVMELGATFEAVARDWFTVWSMKADKNHAPKQWQKIENHLLPALGFYPIAHLTDKPTILNVFKVIAFEKGIPETARKMFQACRAIFAHAELHGLIPHNPLAGVLVGSIVPKVKTEHHPHVTLDKVGELLRAIDGLKEPHSRIGLQLIALTFVRHGELIGARWSDIDFKRSLWIIPADEVEPDGRRYGMKMRTEHYVPLSTQAIERLKELRKITGGGRYLFPSMNGGKTAIMSNAVMSNALKRLGYQGVQDVHGFRGLAKKCIMNRCGYAEQIVEVQLSHLTGNEVSRAYGSKDFMAERIEMMQTWADYLDGQRYEGVARPTLRVVG